MGPLFQELIDASRGLLGAYGGDVPDWLTQEADRLQDALDAITKAVEPEPAPTLYRQCWEFYDWHDVDRPCRWVVASDSRDAERAAQKRGWRREPGGRLVGVQLGNPDWTDKQWKQHEVDIVLK